MRKIVLFVINDFGFFFFFFFGGGGAGFNHGKYYSQTGAHLTASCQKKCLNFKSGVKYFLLFQRISDLSREV